MRFLHPKTNSNSKLFLMRQGMTSRLSFRFKHANMGWGWCWLLDDKLFYLKWSNILELRIFLTSPSKIQALPNICNVSFISTIFLDSHFTFPNQDTSRVQPPVIKRRLRERWNSNANSINSLNCYRERRRSSFGMTCASSFFLIRNVIAISMTAVASIYDWLSQWI